LTAIRGGAPDQTPFTVWHHFYLDPSAGPSSRMADAELEFHARYRPDLLKVMHDVAYEQSGAINRPHDWTHLPILDPATGNFGAQLHTLAAIRDGLDSDVPMIDTVFGVYHYANEISHGKLLYHLRESPIEVHKGLSAIAQSLASYAQATLETGCEGIYYALSGASGEGATREEYRKHFFTYDLQILASVAQASINILHLHGYEHLYFDRMRSLPASVLCWSDRAGGPSLAHARRIHSGCLMGGLDETRFAEMTPDEIVAQGQEAIAQMEGRGFILSPGCSIPEMTTPDRIAAIREAVQARLPRMKSGVV
jgi:uroporphyrinogen decarboxylase